MSFFVLIFFSTFHKANKSSTLIKIFVQRVVDGDTFIDSNQKRYRIFGIDAPELSDKIRGTIAKNVLNQWINQQFIAINKITSDIYHRDVVKVYFKDRDIGLEMIKFGFAKVAFISLDPKNPFFSKDVIYFRQLLEVQHKAYKKGAGFWGENKYLWYD